MVDKQICKLRIDPSPPIPQFAVRWNPGDTVTLGSENNVRHFGVAFLAGFHSISYTVSYLYYTLVVHYLSYSYVLF